MKAHSKPLHKLVLSTVLVFKKIVPLILVILFVLTLVTVPSSAQTTDDSWTSHLNLSNSGSTLDPVVVSDSDGRIHVLWQDTYSGFVYSLNENDQWSSPVSVEFPFGINRILYKPTLIASNDGNIHAFWLDDRGYLSHTRVLGQNFGVSTSWDAPQVLGVGLSGFAVTVDDADILHLAYLNTEETGEVPAGIYYQQSRDGGRNWSERFEIYLSPYLRGASDENSNLSIAATSSDSGQRVYVAWDNHPLKRIYLAISEDGGLNWGPANEIDAPDLASGAASSFGVLVGAAGNNAHLIWQRGDPESSCNHFYQWSNDGGVTWSERLQMPAHLVGCAEDHKFITYQDDFGLLETTIDDQVYFVAWNGEQWSEPQVQEPLISFVDPQTLEVIQLGCRSYDFLPERNLISVAGCDADEVGDIWLTSRLIENTADLFGPDPIWTPPLTVTSGVGQIISPILLTDSTGLVHLVWIQEEEVTSEETISNIYYSQWNGLEWTPPLAPFGDSDDSAASLSADIGTDDILSITWNNFDSMENSFSWTNTQQAQRTTEWAEVELLPYTQLIGSSPEVYIDPLNTIFIVTEIPINEGRGVYTIQSNDFGQSWSEPTQIFDGASAGWPIVADARLTGTYDGRKHLILTQYSIPGGPGPQALYYARSDDNGVSWLEPVLVENSQVTWSRILGFGDSVVHIIWQEIQSDLRVIRHQYSMDGGTSWSSIATISNFGNANGEPSVALDPAGHVHLNQMTNEAGGNLELKYWIWDGERWNASEGTNLGLGSVNNDHESTSVATNLGELNFAYSDIIKAELSDGVENVIFNSHRSIELPETLPTFSPALSPPATQQIPEPEPELTPTLIPSPELTATPTVEINSDTSSSSTNLAGLGLVFGGALVILIIIILVVVLRLRGHL